MKQLIVNADDYGFTPGVIQGILEAHEHGIVTSTTLMANMPSAQAAFEAAKRYPDLGVGIHMNLTVGPALSGRSELLGPNRMMMVENLGRLPEIPVEAIEQEFRAQMERFLSWGGHPTHVDGHMFVSYLEPAADITLRLAQEFGVPAARTVSSMTVQEMTGERLTPFSRGLFSSRFAGVAEAEAFVEHTRRSITEAGLKQTDHFSLGPLFGVTDAGLAKQRLLAWLERMPEGSVEVMTHPGYIDDELRAIDRLLDPRPIERMLLADPEVREAVKRNNIQLINYRAIG